ncbi:unnamed protein product [Pseudo-nitzschia multistriata]|uniref:VWFA domain-containing protein n=1 Tax=Pseudo-nitzschia multistriata TaxID=183589 RepID=A0A448Z054_9STRA|nr:unnamed protein product [Pseudo-nitzschia multistriata]
MDQDTKKNTSKGEKKNMKSKKSNQNKKNKTKKDKKNDRKRDDVADAIPNVLDVTPIVAVAPIAAVAIPLPDDIHPDQHYTPPVSAQSNTTDHQFPNEGSINPVIYPVVSEIAAVAVPLPDDIHPNQHYIPPVSNQPSAMFPNQEGRNQPNIGSPISGNGNVKLKDQGYSSGLIYSIGLNNVICPLRIWVVDNSGSMKKRDGHRISENKRTKQPFLLECTRWAEMQDTVEYHARMAAQLESPTVFRLLNKASTGQQQFSIGERGHQFIQEDLNIALETIWRTVPNGKTPLVEHIYQIRSVIMPIRNSLCQDGQKVVVVIATDGLPTDSSGTICLERFKVALRSLLQLPILLVIRLCTDMKSVVKFYHKLDADLEYKLEVLDDFFG